jgi:hypothetical protein
MALVGIAAVIGLAAGAAGQPVTLVDEQVIRPVAGGDGVVPSTWSAKLSPDGTTLVYFVGPQQDQQWAAPGQVVIRRLVRGADEKVAEFRPDLGKPTASDFHMFTLYRQPFTRDGKLLILPDCTRPQPKGGEKRRPILLCQVATGQLARTEIEADLRYTAIDGTGQMLLYSDGQGFSLTTGKRIKPFAYQGLVESANPVAPLVLVNDGREGRPRDRPQRVHVWNLRDNRLLATLPTNFKHPSTDDVMPEWTSDGTFVYFVDVTDEKDPEEPRTTRVWNVKTRQLVGQPFQEAIPLGPGPRPATMFLRQWRGDETAYVLHDAVSGTRVELPLKFHDVHDALGDKVAYVKLIEGEPHLCVATVKWELPGDAAPPSRQIR